MAAVLVLLSLLVYLVYNLLPVDKAADMAMQEIAANKHLNYAERYLYWQRRYGLDGSLFKRYLRWIGVAPFYDGAFKGLLQDNLGTSVSYGGTFTAGEKMKIATIPVGYGDGYPRSLSGRGYVLIHGQKAPQRLPRGRWRRR